MSVVATVNDWQGLLQELKTEWSKLKPSYEHICLLAYLLWKALPKNGSAGKVTMVLDDLNIRRNTFYSWVRYHRVAIGEIVDSDTTEDPGPTVDSDGSAEANAHDEDGGDQDEEDAEGFGDGGPAASAQGRAARNGSRRGSRRKPIWRSAEPKTYSIHLQGNRLRKFADALLCLRQHYQYGTDADAIYQSVLREAERLTHPHGGGPAARLTAAPEEVPGAAA